MSAHQEYQRTLHEFKDWLEQQQERLSCYTQLEGDVETLEETLRKLQVRRCLEGLIVTHYLFIFIYLDFKTSCRIFLLMLFLFSYVIFRKKTLANDLNAS